ncbi:hypothetical protein [Ruminococcus sp. NK3A76]|uniref:hypothetical protein n=1 Tax=Ruminococcus sp. NK3A76 TaxID=877411 RepID=UPI00048A7A54|nr:hypothetical protein [Ruminococcus sp. NK3A76]
MSLFRRKPKETKPTYDELIKTSIMPPYEYVPEDHLWAFLETYNIELTRVKNGEYTVTLADGQSVEVSNTTEMVQAMKPVIDEKVLKMINMYSNKDVTLEKCLIDRMALYGRSALFHSEEDAKLYDAIYDKGLHFYEFADLFVNKANGINLDEFYQSKYEVPSLFEELNVLENDEVFCLYNFNSNPDEMVEFYAHKGEDLEGKPVTEYSLSLNHTYHRFPEDKWRFCMVGSIDGVSIENVEAELEHLKDDQTFVKNPYYKVDFNGRYPISELKEWIKTCNYEKAMKETAKKMIKGFGK